MSSPPQCNFHARFNNYFFVTLCTTLYLNKFDKYRFIALLKSTGSCWVGQVMVIYDFNPRTWRGRGKLSSSPPWVPGRQELYSKTSLKTKKERQFSIADHVFQEHDQYFRLWGGNSSHPCQFISHTLRSIFLQMYHMISVKLLCMQWYHAFINKISRVRLLKKYKPKFIQINK